jgi:hypothetical protein
LQYFIHCKFRIRIVTVPDMRLKHLFSLPIDF